jgi:2-methylcitrate dehydratase
MKIHKMRVYPSKVNLPKENQLAWKIARVALDDTPIDKFRSLTGEIITPSEQNRFIELVQQLPDLGSRDIRQLNVQVPAKRLKTPTHNQKGIF